MAATKAVELGTKLWVAVVHHNHGENFHVSITKEGLFEQLFEFVKEWWKREMEGQTMPEDHGEAIDQYFARLNEVGEEFYEWGETELGA